MIEFVDEIIVTGSDVSSVSFGSGGDGELGTALDGDADVLYLLESIWYPTVSSAEYLYLDFNGLTTNQLSKSVQVTSTSFAYYSQARTTISKTSNANGNPAFVTTKIFAVSGYPRLVTTTAAIHNTLNNSAINVFSSVWDNTADNITSLGLSSQIALGIKIGSHFKLYKNS